MIININNNKKYQMKSFKNIKKSGLTIIEVILALSIGAVVIINVILFLSELSYKERMKIVAGNIMSINSGFMRKVQHDGSDFERFIDNEKDGTAEVVAGVNATTVDINNYIYWDVGDFASGLLNDVLVPVEACGAGGSWIPKDSETGSEIRTVPLIPCGLYNDGLPLGFEMRAVLRRDNNPSNFDEGLARFTIFIDFSNSELYTRSSGLFSGGTNTNAQRIVEFMNYLDARKSADLYGTQSVELVRAVDGSFDDESDYVAALIENVDPSDCFLGGGVSTCQIAIHIGFTGGNNQQFLRTDGENGMLRPIKFALNGADAREDRWQTCARWTRLDTGDWRQDLVECGIQGGTGYSVDKLGNPMYPNTSNQSGVQGVFSQTNTEGLYITYRDPAAGENVEQVDSMTALSFCEMFTSPPGTDFIGGIGSSVEVPCGIYVSNVIDGDPVVQVVADTQTIETMFSENIKVVDIAARRLRIKQEREGDVPFVIYPHEEGADAIYRVVDNGSYFTFMATGNLEWGGNVEIDGTLKVNGNGEFIGNITQTGAQTTFDLTDKFAIIFGDLSMVATKENSSSPGSGGISSYFPSGIDYFNIDFFNDVRLSASNVAIQGTDSIILDSDKIIIDGTLIAPTPESTYSVISHFDNSDLDYAATLSGDEKKLRSFVTRDYVKHLENTKGNIILKYVNVITPENSFLPKPDCLDFISEGENLHLYDGSPAASLDGQSLARIVLVPISFKTYANSYGSNQFFTHHAQDAGSGWEIYFYISGDGTAGTGAREDGAGTSLALVFCDYEGVVFRKP